jgi:transcriptional regulator with XRE-family HTH domain
MATLKVGSLGDYIREQRESAQVSLRQLARSAGVSNPYLSQIERGVKKPSAEILAQIAKGLRISAETLYVRAGILDERSTGDVVAAVLADPGLGQRHKRVLIDVYESFRAEHAAESARTAASATATRHTAKTATTRAAAKKSTAKKSTAPKRSAPMPTTTTTKSTTTRRSS